MNYRNYNVRTTHFNGICMQSADNCQEVVPLLSFKKEKNGKDKDNDKDKEN